jgi:ABC-type bacteriocin/lantibiotic exporter with double-glycine peptidase domain
MFSAHLLDRPVPYFKQLRRGECGITCLLMILRSLGHRVTIETLRTVAGDAQCGSTARQLLVLARHFGLPASYRIQAEPGDLASIAPPLILHWDFQHFVVLEQLNPVGGARIIDPIAGPAWVTRDEFNKKFTGVALFFSPASELDIHQPDGGTSIIRAASPFRSHMRLTSAHTSTASTCDPPISTDSIDQDSLKGGQR